MFPNWTGWKTVKAILFVLTGVTALVPDAYKSLYTAILGSVGTIVVALSGTNVGPAVARATVKTLTLLALVCLCAGCLATAPTVPVTPANQQQITSCTSIGALHNGFVVGDFVVGAGGVGVASAAAIVSDVPTKDVLSVVGIALGAISAAGTAIVGFTGAEFSSSQCGNVVGPLPMKPAPQSRIVWVPDPVTQ